MATLMQASNQWASRPADERFVSLLEMHAHLLELRHRSSGKVVATNQMKFVATSEDDPKELAVVGPSGVPYNPTHWSFGQAAGLVKAPAGYLRTLPARVTALNMNIGLAQRDVEDVGILVEDNGQKILRAATGPNYGRIWNVDIVEHLIRKFGDGITGPWKVPGEFGRDVTVTKANTTLYAGDRDCFIFLCDEKNRIENPARGGEPMARGFFVWNSEVGKCKIGIATFYFDHVCCNRIIWGSSEFKQFNMVHSSGAPARFVEEIQPAIESYAEASAAGITDAINAARKRNVKDKVDDLLREYFGSTAATAMKKVHEAEEERPIETLWDLTTAATAYARSIPFQDERVEVETKAGKFMDMATM